MEQKTIWEKDLKHVVHPYTNFKYFKQEGSTIFEQAKGHIISDIDGNRYLDGMAGLWCVNIGHGNEELIEHMSEQAHKMAYFNTFEDASSAPAAELAAKLSDLCPGSLNHVFFGTGGSIANDTAIKLVHYYFNMLGKHNKKKVISRDLGYHGSTYLAHTLTGIRPTHEGFDLAPDLVHYVSAPYAYRNAGEMNEGEFCDHLIKELEAKILELGPENVACFIAEPIMGAGGVIVPPKGYHRRSWELCKQYEVLYISDEVVNAFGRLGHMVASQDVFDIVPDIMVFAKGISSGYIPLGATVFSEEIYEVISQPKAGNPYFSHGFTYSGHALACAVGVKNIEILEKEDFCGHVRKWGPYFEEVLAPLAEHPIVGEVRGSHYMMALELVRDKETKETFDDDIMISRRIYKHCKSRGLMLRPIGPLLVLSPPLSFDKEAMDQTVAILDESIKATLNDLRKEGLF